MAIDIFKRRSMVAMISTRVPLKTWFMNTFFQDRLFHDTDTFDIDIEKEGQSMAAYGHPLREGKLVLNEGFSTKSYKPSYVNEHTITTAGHLLNDRQAGGTVYSDGKTPTQRAVEKMAKDFDKLDRRFTRLEEHQCAEAIVYGKVTISDDEETRVVNYNRNADHSIVLLNTANWADPASDPIEDIRQWAEMLEDNGLHVPDIILFGSVVNSYFRKHAKVKEYFDVRNYHVGQFKPEFDKVKGLKHLWTLDEFGLEVFSYSGKYQHPDTGVMTPYMPELAVMMASTDARNTMHYGVIQDLDAVESASHVTDRYPQSYVEGHPKKRFVSLQSAPLAANHTPDTVMVAWVIDPTYLP